MATFASYRPTFFFCFSKIARFANDGALKVSLQSNLGFERNWLFSLKALAGRETNLPSEKINYE
jgi:hypothetical protein